MKKIIAAVLTVCFIFSLCAVNIFAAAATVFEENFNGAAIPADWILNSLGAADAKISAVEGHGNVLEINSKASTAFDIIKQFTVPAGAETLTLHFSIKYNQEEVNATPWLGIMLRSSTARAYTTIYFRNGNPYVAIGTSAGQVNLQLDKNTGILSPGTGFGLTGDKAALTTKWDFTPFDYNPTDWNEIHIVADFKKESFSVYINGNLAGEYPKSLAESADISQLFIQASTAPEVNAYIGFINVSVNADPPTAATAAPVTTAAPQTTQIPAAGTTNSPVVNNSPSTGNTTVIVLFISVLAVAAGSLIIKKKI